MLAPRHLAPLAALSLVLASGCAEPVPAGGDGSCAVDARCGGCSSDTDCTKGQHCDPNSGSCYACVTDDQCPPGDLCGPMHTCTKGCSTAHPCGDAGVCAADAGACVECQADKDCTDKSRPRCDTTQDKCVPCLPTNDNCPFAQFCEQQGNSYGCAAGCKDDGDCAVDGGTTTASHCDKTQHKCVDCLLDNDCPLGKVCHNGSCTDGCSKTQGCQQSLMCCNSLCVDTTTDYQNCGACGKTCANGWNCCSSTCSNPATDTQNCGGCGIVCTAPNGSPACVLRKCAIGSCNPGWADCNGAVLDGCETNTNTNVANCGGCNNPCSLPNASPKCVGGTCQIAACNFPYADCDGNPMNGCEDNTFSDVNNCGGCGTVCNLPHATAKCQLGICAIGSCDPGWADCNNDPKDGCEVNLTSDPGHCGGCGIVCSSVNGTPSCVSSNCQIACNTHFGNCDNNVTNGCESNLLTDTNNCGGCGTNCNNLTQHVSGSTCSSGACTVTGCQSNYYDLDGSWSDGCECLSDTTGSACNGPTAITGPGLGGSTTVTGNLVPGGNEDWYQVTFVSNASTSYHPKVALTTNPGGYFRLDVQNPACGGAFQGCGDGGTSNGRTTWEVFYTGGDPNSTFYPIPAVGSNGTVFIRVYRVAGPVTCDNFVLTISN